MNRTLFTAFTLSLTLLTAGSIKPVQAGDLPPVPTSILTTAIVGQQNADDEFNAGVDAQRNKQWEKAANAFSNCIKKDPSYVVAYFSRADCYRMLRQWDKTIADYTQVINKKPKLADAYRLRGQAYNNLKQPDKALPDLDEALRLRPSMFEAYSDRAQAYFLKKDYDKAIADYTVFIERIKRTRQAVPDVYNNRGQAYINRYQLAKADNKADENDIKLALADLDEYVAESTALKLDPSDADLSRGDIYLLTKDYPKAITSYAAYIDKNPKDNYAFERRGRAYEESKNVDAALADFQKALAINPTSESAQSGVTRIMLTRDPKTALVEISKSISNPPKKEQKDKVGSRALIYMSLKDYPNAIRDYEFLLKIDPTDQSALANRATAYLNTNTYDKAIADYDAYLAQNPKDDAGVANALTGKASAQISLKQYDQAAATFSSIIAKNEAAKKDDPTPYFNRGKAYFNMKAYDRALPDVQKYTAAKPDDKDAAKLQSDIELLMAEKAGPDAQIALLKKAIANDPKNTGAQLNLGAIYFKQEKFDDAITAYNGVIAADPKNAIAYYSRASAYAKKKDWDNAAKDASAALAAQPDYSDALLLRAQSSLEGKKYTDAIRDYEVIYAKDKTNSDALKGLAFSYVANKDYANTIRIMGDYIAKNPTDLEAVYSRGVAYVGLMKYPEGIADLTKYISGGGKDQASALYNRGLANSKAGNSEAAVADYEASLAQKSSYDVALNAGKEYIVQADKVRDSDTPKAVILYGKAGDIYGKALAAIDTPDNKDADLPKKKAEVLRSLAIARQNQGLLGEKVDVVKDALDIFNKYLAIARPLNLPEVPEAEKSVDKLTKYIKENS